MINENEEVFLEDVIIQDALSNMENHFDEFISQMEEGNNAN